MVKKATFHRLVIELCIKIKSDFTNLRIYLYYTYSMKIGTKNYFQVQNLWCYDGFLNNTHKQEFYEKKTSHWCENSFCQWILAYQHRHLATAILDPFDINMAAILQPWMIPVASLTTRNWKCLKHLIMCMVGVTLPPCWCTARHVVG